MSPERSIRADIELKTEDGHSLQGRLFGRIEEAKVLVIINSALGVKQEFYSAFAQWLSGRGACVLTYDYRGNGLSGGARLRGMRATLTDWGRYDFSAGVDYLLGLAPTLPLVCVGHSIGGQLLGMLPDKGRISGLYAVCAQIGYWRLWSGSAKLKALWLFFILIPVTTFFCGYFPGSLFGLSDLPRGVAREWARGCRSLGSARDRRRERLAEYRGPAMFMSVYDDLLFAPSPSVDLLASYYCNAEHGRIHVLAEMAGGRGIGHFGFFRSPHGRHLWPKVPDWMFHLPVMCRATSRP